MPRSLTALHARETVAGMDRSAPRVPYVEAARSLLRTSVLDAVRDLLRERDWSKITLSDVAKRAGVSRQTVYNEFGSRLGLAQAYALQLADDFASHVDTSIWANVGDAAAALTDGLRAFFIESASDPLIQSLRTGEVKPDLLRLITIDAAPIIMLAREKLSYTFQHSWVDATPEDAESLAEALVRLAMSYIAMPPVSDADVSVSLAAVLAPFVEAVQARK